VVTHDRAFLDRVCTAVLAFEGEGEVVRYASRLQHLDARQARRKAAVTPPAPVRPPRQHGRKGPSYAERQELAALPERIEALEDRMAELEALLARPETYRDQAERVPALTTELSALPAQIEALYQRWELLSEG